MAIPQTPHTPHTHTQPTPAGGGQAEEGEGEGEGPWEKGIELDAPDARGLRPIHLAARQGLTVRVLWYIGGSFVSVCGGGVSTTTGLVSSGHVLLLTTYCACESFDLLVAEAYAPHTHIVVDVDDG
jgi:hypothetical protein